MMGALHLGVNWDEFLKSQARGKRRAILSGEYGEHCFSSCNNCTTPQNTVSFRESHIGTINFVSFKQTFPASPYF